MEKISSSIRILITDSHELAGLGALRSIGRAGYHVIAGYPDHLKRPASTWSRYCTEVVRYPDPWKYQNAFQEWLLNQTKMGVFDILLPISEASLFATAILRNQLPHQTMPILPSDSALTFALSKYHATRKAMETGIPCPATVFVSDGISKLKTEELETLHFPIMIRTDNRLQRNGSYVQGQTWKAASLKLANDILDDLEEREVRIIAQEYIPGSGAGSSFLRYRNSICLTFAHRRIHEVPYSGGGSTFRESLVDSELHRLGEKLLNAIDYQGLAMIEFRRLHGKGQLYFLEINGRLWGSIALALHCGVDFPQSLIECYVRDKPISPALSYPVGVKCRNIFPGEIEYVISVLKAKRSNWVKVKTIAGFFALCINPTIHYDYFWISDPIPGFVQAFKIISQIISSAIRRIRDKNPLL